MNYEKKINESNLNKVAKITSSSIVGGGSGYSLVTLSGLTATGAVGTGTGIGAAAVPVGAAVGAVVGVAVYSVYRLFKK